ncbi:MAG: recombinase family protein [Selenomonadaceae bacterium]|nr:recombinase family protein [Selenomonadaceae bacterium]MBR3721169.1 recombinase family protein [Selenomonadaceae bacterium]
MSGRKIAYGRVSTKEQKLDRQIIAFQELGISPKNIFIEKQSGKDFDRPIYQKMIKLLKKGDTLIIKSIDRLGRNYEEIIEEWRYLTREKLINIQVIDTPLINTSPNRDLMGTVFADIILQLQSAFAQAERDNIKQRQAEGIAAAKNRGVRFGPKPRPLTKEFKALKEQWALGNISAREAARRLGICHKTFLKWVKR